MAHGRVKCLSSRLVRDVLKIALSAIEWRHLMLSWNSDLRRSRWRSQMWWRNRRWRLRPRPRRWISSTEWSTAASWYPGGEPAAVVGASRRTAERRRVRRVRILHATLFLYYVVLCIVSPRTDVVNSCNAAKMIHVLDTSQTGWISLSHNIRVRENANLSSQTHQAGNHQDIYLRFVVNNNVVCYITILSLTVIYFLPFCRKLI